MKVLRKLCALILLLSWLASACSTKPQGTPDVSDVQLRDMATNVLQSISNNDYAALGRDFSDDMKKAFTQDQFDKVRTLLDTSSGKFVSIKDTQLTPGSAPGYVNYVLNAGYENEVVKVTMPFKIGGNKIEGLFFDSANIRKNIK